jgi:hypothetical protein
MSQAVVVELPDSLYQQLEQAAKLFRQPMAKIVEQSLQHSLPPLLEDIPAEYQREVFPLLAMSDRELQSEAQQVFDPDLWAEYDALLDKKTKPLSTTKKSFGLTCCDARLIFSLCAKATPWSC